MPKNLRLDLPPNLPRLLGYKGHERYFQIYWEPKCGLVSTDRQGKYFVATDLAFHLFSLKFSFDLAFTYLFNTQAAMLFDCRTQCLYGGERETIAQMLEEPDCVRLIEPADVRNQSDYILKIKEFATSCKFSIRSFAKAIVITFLVSATAFVGMKVLNGIMDTDPYQHAFTKDNDHQKDQPTNKNVEQQKDQSWNKDMELQKDQSLLPSEYK